VRDAAQLAGVHVKSVRRWVAQGRLVVYRYSGHQRHVLVVLDWDGLPADAAAPDAGELLSLALSGADTSGVAA
jgi:hypothetical protein